MVSHIDPDKKTVLGMKNLPSSTATLSSNPPPAHDRTKTKVERPIHQRVADMHQYRNYDEATKRIKSGAPPPGRPKRKKLGQSTWAPLGIVAIGFILISHYITCETALKLSNQPSSPQDILGCPVCAPFVPLPTSLPTSLASLPSLDFTSMFASSSLTDSALASVKVAWKKALVTDSCALAIANRSLLYKPHHAPLRYTFMGAMGFCRLAEFVGFYIALSIYLAREKKRYSTTSVNYGELGGVPLSTLVVAAALLKTVLLACGAVKLARAGLGRAPGAGSGARTDAAGSSAVKKKD